MRTYEEMYSLIMETAEQDERVRAVTMEGSHTVDGATHDRYSDFDITFFVTDIREFTKGQAYMHRFGDILIQQCPDDWYEEPYDYASRKRFTYLTQYKDGNRIDLTLIDISEIGQQAGFDEPRRVLLNKDGFAELKDIESNESHWIRKPSEFEYFHTCNEFRWLSNYVTKGLCRDEFFYAWYMKEHLMMDMLMKMLNWKVAVDHDFRVTTGSHSKYLKRFLSEAEMNRFRFIFTNGETGDMTFKLFVMYDYFAELAQYVGEKLGYPFDKEESDNVKAFMKQRMDEACADKNKGAHG